MMHRVMKMWNPPHPGLLLKSVLQNLPKPIGGFAAQVGLSDEQFQRVLDGKAPVTADLAPRLVEAFDMFDADMWCRIQASYDQFHAEHPDFKEGDEGPDNQRMAVVDSVS